MRSSLISLVLFVGLAGCAIVPPGVAWSPDGKAGLYQEKVIDSEGKSVDQLGPFDGSVAWSADSSTLYSTRIEASGTTPPVTPLRRWVDGPDADKDIAKPTTLPVGYPRTTVVRRRNGKTESILTLWPICVFPLAVSSDQQWLLIQATNVNGLYDFQWSLLAYQLQSKKLYLITADCRACCFTAKNQVAYLDDGRIYQSTLDESQAPLASTPLLDVLPNSTTAIACSDKSLLVLTTQATFPSSTTQPTASKIYAVAMDGKQFRELATADMMSLSPDGKRILFIRPTEQGADQLAMMNADGTQVRMLMDLGVFKDGLPLMPTWHGNDRITFAAATGTPVPIEMKKEKADQQRAYDIVDYSIPPVGPMQPVQILSRNWSPMQKPQVSIKVTADQTPAKP
jgi:hypothetical protein